MDPNETLAEILANVRILLDEPSETPTAAQAAVADLLAERVRDLDEWIRKGGFFPRAWQRATVSVPKASIDVWVHRFVEVRDGDSNDAEHDLLYEIVSALNVEAGVPVDL